MNTRAAVGSLAYTPPPSGVFSPSIRRSASLLPSRSTVTVVFGCARPYCARSPGVSLTTSSTSSDSRPESRESTSPLSARTDCGATMRQPSLPFTRSTVSAGRASVTCFTLSLASFSAANTFSLGFSEGPVSRLLSKK